MLSCGYLYTEFTHHWLRLLDMCKRGFAAKMFMLASIYSCWCSLSCSLVCLCRSLFAHDVCHEHSHTTLAAIYRSKCSCCLCLIWPGLGPECAWGDSATGAAAWLWPPSASRGSPAAAVEIDDRPQSFAPLALPRASGIDAVLRPTPSSDLALPYIKPRKRKSLFCPFQTFFWTSKYLF